jgi:hypothetical protein
MKISRWIIVTVLVLSLGLPAMTASAAPVRVASISLTAPVPNPVMVGSEITFGAVISVSDITPGVAGAEIYVSYDPALVSLPTTPGAKAAEVLPDFFGVSNFSINEVLPAAQCPGGVSPCVHLVLAGPAQVTQTGIAARFHFIAKAGGSACFSVLQSNLADADGFAVDHTKATQQCVKIVPPLIRVTGTVLRQGTPASPNPGLGSLACSSVTAIGTATFGPSNTDTSGKFAFDLPVDTYLFRASYPGYLSSEKAGVSITGAVNPLDVGTTKLLGGDVNADKAINILDIGAIISKFGQTGVAVKSASAGCAGADEAADINDDGNINISDLAITAGNWGKTGPTTWQP